MSQRRNLYSYKSKRPAKSKKFKWILLLFVLSAIYVIFFYTNDYIINRSKYALENTEQNYGREVDSLCEKMDLPKSYIKALIMLETSGRVPVTTRFEEHVYIKLRLVKLGKKRQYENITTAMLRHTSDESLRNMATSWGPFQIMGYKCVQLRIKLHNLRGKDAVYWGMKWISDDYGYLLRQGRYKDAFHFHNTGKEYPLTGEPLTYDPSYVSHGLKYMTFFKK
jgi:hypothetical protein